MIYRWYTAHYHQRIQHLGWLNNIYSLGHMTYEAISLPAFFALDFFPYKRLSVKVALTAFLYPLLLASLDVVFFDRRWGDHAHYTVPSCDVWTSKVREGEGDFSMEFLVYLESILRSSLEGQRWVDDLLLCFQFKDPSPKLKKESKKILIGVAKPIVWTVFWDLSAVTVPMTRRVFPEVAVSFLTGKSKLNHWSNKIHPGEDGDRFQSWTKNPYVSTTTYLLGAATTQPYTWQLPF